ncbi:MAG: BlaI/MecI/CopY family transcriptional regulator [Candidatus Binatia bacterium]
MPRPTRIPRLGELEEAVLEHLWGAGTAGVVETHEAVGRRRGISPNTVGSALERLYRKGLVSRAKVSHAYQYAPRLGREEFYARRAIDAAGGLSALGDQGLLAAFVDLVGEANATVLDRLERLITTKRRKA